MVVATHNRGKLGEILDRLRDLPDDGRGLQVERLREKALASGHADALKKDLSELVFMRGLSTAEGADLHRGRGVGMSMVRRRVEEAGGSIRVESKKDAFCEIIVSLPP